MRTEATRVSGSCRAPRREKDLGAFPPCFPLRRFHHSDSRGPCSPDLLATLATKRTPIVEVKFTPRNLCLAAGPMRETS